MPNDPTPEQITQHYSACLDSVALIHDVIATPEKYAVDPTAIERNVRHLEGMRTAAFWADEDMAPIDAAIVAGNAAMSANG